MKFIYPLLLALATFLYSPRSNANPVLPLPDGAIAPNFTLTDINGTTHNLYNYLDQGKMVILDFSATWCGPCWNYHNAHILRDVYNLYGPNGSDEIMVLFIEADNGTPLSALYGTGNTQGDWVTGTPYPIINDASQNSAYNISFFPTLYAVCQDRKIYEAGQTSVQGWLDRAQSCSLDGSVVTTDVSCSGNNDGAIDLTQSGGYGSVSMNWSNGATTEDISNLSSGLYSVTMTDAFNRQVSVDNIFVSEAPQINPITTQTNAPDCYGDSNGSATVLVTGGTPGYSLVWSNGQTGNTISGVTAGTYNLQVTDNANCVENHTVVITEPQPLAVNETVLPENCGNSDGLLVITAIGGTVPYTYDFGNGPTPIPTLNGLSAGTYDVTVEDLNGCLFVDSYEVPEVPAPTADAGTALSLNCLNAEVTLDGSGSSSGAEFVYTWTTDTGNIVSGADTQSPVVDAAGTYTLEVFNSTNACFSTADVVVTEDIAAPTADAGSDAILDCSSSTVTLSGTASQGANFEYLWSSNDGNIVSGADQLDVDVDAAGTYTLLVTNTTNGCTASSDVVVSSIQDLPAATAGTDEVLSCTVTELILDGTGSEAGTDITYQWTTDNGNIVSGGETLNPTINAAGTYILEVINNANGCSSTDEVIITEDVNLPSADAGSDAVIDCNNADATLIATASTGVDFTYQWTDADGTVLSTELEAIVDAGGTYTFEVVNTTNGCTNSSTVEVTEELDLPLADAGVDAEFDCTTVELTLDGSQSDSGAEFSYSWTTTDGTILSGADSVNPVVSTHGTYVIEVTNTATGCVSTDEILVADNTSAPVIDAEVLGVLDCDNGLVSIDASASTGSDGSLSFTWITNDGAIVGASDNSSIELNQPGTYTVNVSDSGNNCSSTEDFVIEGALPVELALDSSSSASCHDSEDGTATVIASGGDGNFTYLWPDGSTAAENTSLGAGEYLVEVTDGNDCTSSVLVEITSPDALVLTGIATDETSSEANDGTATVVANGGTGTYTYEWSNGSTTSTIEGLTPGVYQVVVTDENGCSELVDLTINAFGCSISASVESQQIDCFGANNGAATVVYEGNSEISTVLWSNGATGVSVDGLSPGVYTVEILDENNCPAEAIVEIIEPEAISIDAVETDLSCFESADGSIDLTANGGTGNLSYQWSNGADQASIDDLESALYIIDVLDENGCLAQAEFFIDQPELLETEIESQAIDCNGNATGALTLSPTGGTADYSVLWSTGSTDLSITDLTAGTYTYTLTDANGCTLEESLDLMEPTAIETFVSAYDVACFGEANGSIAVEVIGGAGAYVYEWSTGGTEPVLDGLAAGVYTYVVEDANGCSVSEEITINEPEAIILENAEVTNANQGQEDGSVTVTIDGGVAPYSYSWTDADGNVVSENEDLEAVGAGDYVLTVLDASGCTFTSEVYTVDELTSLTNLSNGITATIRPNPSPDKFLLELNGLTSTKEFRLELINLSGKSIMNKKIELDSEYSEWIDLSTQSAGVYLLRIQSEDSTVVYRLIKE